ncbi:FHA domain-containing protein [Bacillus sp. 31A1R]|uniref:FHA domain-containing protein n=1 Tax=Robertmurraya mangrovi TaxID=3098077 RepID=A0ABU5J0Z6_9BACI|nr:FHA domain-containing protein [Bacillus sp. 31A1R]MDZ5473051.1 FHA domain-containing protein [Bacillus sp. 31A1R]
MMMDYYAEFLFLMLFMFAFSILFYIIYVFCMFRLGRKFGIGSFWGYAVPIYNLYLINQCAGLPTNYLFLLLIPGVGPLIWGTMAYGKIAERLGKDYWIFGLGTALVGIPFFIMAFDKSMPVNSGINQVPLPPNPGPNLAVTPPLSTVPDPRFTGSTAFLVGSSGMYQGAVIPIPAEGVVIGRDPQIANIIISEESVSKSHVRISLHPQSFDTVIVEDLGSTHGTYYLEGPHLQWSKIQGPKPFSSLTPAQLRIGSTEEIFEIKFVM